ncbi:MAG: hypothetical protein O3C67_01525 [Cyanobacteria bacterium]|nr:hypothetical protein [Cyanobacteriota bacterium]
MALGYLALLLQSALLLNLWTTLRWGLSLRGEAWEWGLLAIAAIASTLFLSRPPQGHWSRWQRRLYGLNLFCLIPLLLTAALMAVLMYAIHPMGTFQSGQGAIVTLKEHAGLLGCSIHPYRVTGPMERLIDQGDNYIHCFQLGTDQPAITTTRWNDDQTQLTLSAAGETYTFNLTE